MSFGAPQSVKNAQNQQGGITEQANANASTLNNLGTASLNSGTSNINSGTNFLNTLLNGNQANTASVLSPTLNADRAQSQQQLQSLSTLTPRGGGRSGTLFGAAYQPSASIQNLFNTGRTQAAQTLPQIGLAQQGIGTNLFGAGNSALNTASGSNQASLQSATQQQQISNGLVSGLAGSLLGLATVPFGGGSATNGLLGLIPGCWIAEAIYGHDDRRTHVARAWLNGPFKRTRSGAIVMAVYLTIGRQVAVVVKRSVCLRFILKPLFDIALASAPSTFVEVF